MAWLQKTKSISQMDRDTVMGYNRSAQKLLVAQRILEPISQLCLFYYSQNDYFAKCGDGMVIHKGNTITVTTRDLLCVLFSAPI